MVWVTSIQNVCVCLLNESYYQDWSCNSSIAVKNGENNIERNSRDSNVYVEDQPDTKTLIKSVQQAQQGGETFYYTEVSTYSFCNKYMFYELNWIRMQAVKTWLGFEYNSWIWCNS